MPRDNNALARMPVLNGVLRTEHPDLARDEILRDRRIMPNLKKVPVHAPTHTPAQARW